MTDRPSIMVIDDDPDMLATLRAMLEPAGFDITGGEQHARRDRQGDAIAGRLIGMLERERGEIWPKVCVRV